jgi:hypothetical protein
LPRGDAERLSGLPGAGEVSLVLDDFHRLTRGRIEVKFSVDAIL